MITYFFRFLDQIGQKDQSILPPDHIFQLYTNSLLLGCRHNSSYNANFFLSPPVTDKNSFSGVDYNMYVNVKPDNAIIHVFETMLNGKHNNVI